MMKVQLIQRLGNGLGVLILLVSATGCGTIQCLCSTGNRHPGFHYPAYPAPNAVYGGVKRDLIANPYADTPGPRVLDILCRTIDFPLSFVMDSILLPYTLLSDKTESTRIVGTTRPVSVETMSPIEATR